MASICHVDQMVKMMEKISPLDGSLNIGEYKNPTKLYLNLRSRVME